MKKIIKTWLCSLLLICSVSAFAQYDDCTLTEAFMRQDMSVWDRYMHAYNFNSLSQKEKLRYLSYEYGYVATAIEQKAADAKTHLTNFEAHIDAVESVLPAAKLLCYRSSAAAYHALYNKMLFVTKGAESYSLVKQAYATDSLDPGVLTLKGNVDFYAPKSLGGNKQRGMNAFFKARRIYEQRGLTHCNWNYLSCCLCIIQGYQKMGKFEKAIDECKALLKKEPNYVYVRNTLLPELERQKAERDAQK